MIDESVVPEILLGLRPGARRIAIVSCGKAKQSFAGPASSLYTSPLFQKSIRVARRVSDRVYILSAEYGLISDDTFIHSYDKSLRDLSDKQYSEWKSAVSRRIADVTCRYDEVVLFCGKLYSEAIKSSLTAATTISDPLSGLGLGKRIAFLSSIEKVFARHDAARRLYESLAIADVLGNRSSLIETIRNYNIPRRGLYIFSDSGEHSSVCPGQPRVVRIGTHAVSQGSISTLRSRLRTHLGTASGMGSHRSSIFRAHVGECLARSQKLAEYPAWGTGMSASEDVRSSEEPLERLVSSYIGKLLVTVVPLDDEAGKGSIRAVAEKALIGLFTEHAVCLERAAPAWLGRYSTREAIRLSGLWNVQHYGVQADLKAVEFLSGLIRAYRPERRRKLSNGL